MQSLSVSVSNSSIKILKVVRSPTLFLMFGYPGAGKSSFARALAEAHTFHRVSYDELRGRMWPDKDAHDTPGYQPLLFGALDYAVEQLLTAGVSVIYDVNNNRQSERAAVAALAEHCKAQMVVVWMRTSLDVSREREASRELIENHRMSPEKYQSLVDSMEDPGANEKVIQIDGMASFEDQLKAFESQLQGMV